MTRVSVFYGKAWYRLDRAHVSNWWPVSQMRAATSFYVAREAKIVNISLLSFFGTAVVYTSLQRRTLVFAMLYSRDGQTCSMYEPHIRKSKLQRAATYKSKITNSIAMYASFLERLANAILYVTLASTVPLYNISILYNSNKKWKTNIRFFRKLKEPHAKVRKVASGSRAAVWPPLWHR